MKIASIVLLAILGILVVYLGYNGVRIYLTAQVSKKLIEKAVPYQRVSTDYSVPILVLGDSTAVGVGADNPGDTLAGRVSAYLNASSVENYAVSGAVVNDLPGQIAHAKLPAYRLILIQIGANDIIRFHNADTTAAALGTILKTLPKADKVVVISAGDVGGTTLFPIFLDPFYTHLTLAYHAAFTNVVTAAGDTYVNLYNSPSTKLIESQPKKYLSLDGLHPSSAGYALWFDAIKPAL